MRMPVELVSPTLKLVSIWGALLMAGGINLAFLYERCLRISLNREI